MARRHRSTPDRWVDCQGRVIDEEDRGLVYDVQTLVSRRSALGLFGALGAGAMLGVLTLLGALLTGLFAAAHVAYALALSAGVTIYVAASDLIPEVNREDDQPALAYTVFGGLLFFIAVDWLFAEYLRH